MKRFLAPVAIVGAIVLVVLSAACGGSSKKAASTSGATLVGGGPHAEITATPAAPSATPGPLFTLGPNPTVTASGLKYTDEVVGTGVTPARCDQVSVNYIGTFTDGKKFDASADHGGLFTFNLGIGQVIKGWDEGISTMKVGGTRILYVPAALAYGSRGRAPLIPPNTDLLFKVQLVAASPATNNC